MKKFPVLQEKRARTRRKPASMRMFESRDTGLRHAAPYLNLPPQLSGIPNYHGYRIGPGSDLAGADLAGGNFSWVNLRRAGLTKARLAGCRLWGACLTNADLTGADLRRADLTGADLVGADLRGAKLDEACFVGARFSKTTTIFPKRFGDPEDHGMINLDNCLEDALTP